MIIRAEYLDKLELLIDKPIIKLITGVRRCGKTTLLQQLRSRLLEKGVKPEQLLWVSLEALELAELRHAQSLYDYLSSRVQKNKKLYVFLDGIQLVPCFYKIATALQQLDGLDIYVTSTSSNVFEQSSLEPNCFSEIKLYPLSFKEYCQLTGKEKAAAWQQYLAYGGLPQTLELVDSFMYKEYIRGLYHTILLQDVIARKNLKDVALLEGIIKYLFQHLGVMTSCKRIADALCAEGCKTSSITVESYINALLNAGFIYKTERYDIKGKELLKSLEKYYFADISFHTLCLSSLAQQQVLENIVFLELQRRGYQVHIGKLCSAEIAFVVEKAEQRLYFQIDATALVQENYARLMCPLRKIRDNYPKYVISAAGHNSNDDGILHLNIIDFLLEEF